ncbi:MAG: hypothetical protein ACJA00_005284, partial [Myxococcota bacterium]
MKVPEGTFVFWRSTAASPIDTSSDCTAANAHIYTYLRPLAEHASWTDPCPHSNNRAVANARESGNSHVVMHRHSVTNLTVRAGADIAAQFRLASHGTAYHRPFDDLRQRAQFTPPPERSVRRKTRPFSHFPTRCGASSNLCTARHHTTPHHKTPSQDLSGSRCRSVFQTPTDDRTVSDYRIHPNVGAPEQHPIISD